MPQLTGVDILKMMVQLAAGEKIDSSALNSYSLEDNLKYLSSQLFFAEPGKIIERTSSSELLKLTGVLKAGFNYQPGERIPNIENATARAGYFIAAADNKKDLRQRVTAVYDNLKIRDQNGKNLVLREIGENF